MNSHLAAAERLAVNAEKVAIRGKLAIRNVEGVFRLAELTLRNIRTNQTERCQRRQASS